VSVVGVRPRRSAVMREASTPSRLFCPSSSEMEGQKHSRVPPNHPSAERTKHVNTRRRNANTQDTTWQTHDCVLRQRGDHATQFVSPGEGEGATEKSRGSPFMGLAQRSAR